MIERSHGKARPTLPRSSDLRSVETDANPSQGRTTSGRFAPGNRLSEGQRWKASIRRLLGKGASDEQAAGVARAAFGLYLALLRELPSDGASVRVLAALEARHAALAAHFTDRAAELGFETEQGAAVLELASKHGQRAERLAVTALDVATRLRAAKPAGKNPILDAIEAAGSAVREPTNPETTPISSATSCAPAGHAGAAKEQP